MIVAYIDGGSRGNPGPAGYGVRIEDETGTLIEELRGFLGICTNNAAEYQGVDGGVATRISTSIRESDQVRFRAAREADAGNIALAIPDCTLYRQATALRGSSSANHLRSTCGAISTPHADRLANLAMDEGAG